MRDLPSPAWTLRNRGTGPYGDAMDDTRRSDRRLLLAICVIAGATFMVLASLNYMLPPMLDDLGLTTEQGNLALTIPSLASLLVVFVAGRLGDRLGHRRVILVTGLFFILGCLIVALAEGMAMVSIGLFIEGISATAIQIVVVGLLAARFVDPRARAAAFATYGMAYPAVYLVFPVVAGWLTTFVSWRAIPWMWTLAGLVLIAAARFLLPGAVSRPVGELWTPMLAGLFAVGIVQLISHASDYGWTAPITLASAGVVVGAFLACAVLYRRLPNPSLSITPLRNGATTIILAVVILVPVLNTIFFITVALQYMYGESAFQTAVLMIPAQVLAIIGAKYLSEWMTDHLGLKRAGVVLLVLLAGVMAIPLSFTGTTPMWWLLVFACAFSAVQTGVIVVVLNALMSSAPASESGNTAAYEGSATEIGISLGVVLMSALVFGVGQASLSSGLEESGLSSQDAESVMDEMQSNSTSPALSSSYSYPLPDGSDASDVQKDAIADGLKANGAAGIVLCLAAAALFAAHRRQGGDDVEAYATH